MNRLLWWNSQDDAGGVWLADLNSAQQIAEAMKVAGWNVVWTIHSTDGVRPMDGYATALAEWQLRRDQ